jgi:hypothetical protein
VFFIDADERLQLPASFDRPALAADAYHVECEYAATTYARCALVAARLPWKWEGVVHEHLSCDRPFAVETLPGPRIVVSMTHRSHDLVAHRLGGEPMPRLLTGGLACYRLYETADGGYVTVGALEPKFFARLVELLGRADLADHQYHENQEELAAELAAIFTSRSRDAWLEHFGDEDVCVGPVFTREEAAAALGTSDLTHDEVPLGAHTDAWRRDLGVS